MQCPVCKKEVDGSFEICSNCGAILNKPVANIAYYEQDKAMRKAQEMEQAQAQAEAQAQMQAPPPIPPQPMPIPQADGVAAESESSKNTKLIVALAIVGFIIVAIIACVIIGMNSGSSNDYSGNDTYVTNNYYINIDSDLLDIQEKYMVNGRVPDDRLPDLLNEQYTYLDSHKTEYNITNVKKNDTTIYVEFDDGTDYIYDPSEHYDPPSDDVVDDNETTTKKQTTTRSSKIPNFTNVETEMYGLYVPGEMGGSLGFDVYFDTIEDIDGFEVKEYWGEDNSNIQEYNVDISYANMLFCDAQEFPNIYKIRAYRINSSGKKEYNDWLTVKPNEAPRTGDMTNDEFHDYVSGYDSAVLGAWG